MLNIEIFKKKQINNILKNKKKILSKHIIIVPKRFVKKAVIRNKIKRQIRAILQKQKNSQYFIKYKTKQDKIPNYKEIEEFIVDKIKQDK